MVTLGLDAQRICDLVHSLGLAGEVRRLLEKGQGLSVFADVHQGDANTAQCVYFLANIVEALFLIYLQSFLGNQDMLAQLAASVQHIR